MDSKHISNGDEGDRVFSSGAGNYLVWSVAPGLLFKPVFKDINSAIAGSASKRSSGFDCRFGGISMLLKLIVLSSASLSLWLAPLVALDKKIGWHKGIQGASLCIAVACGVCAGNLARKLAGESEIEEIKTRAITADVVDEIATSAYISQQQRQQEAEQILSGQPEREEAVEALKRAWLLDCNEPSEPVTEPLNQPKDNALTVDEERFTNLNLTKNQAIELIQKLRTELNQTQTIEKLWECKKGGGEAWKRAYAQFKNLIKEEK